MNPLNMYPLRVMDDTRQLGFIFSPSDQCSHNQPILVCTAEVSHNSSKARIGISEYESIINHMLEKSSIFKHVEWGGKLHVH